MRDSAHTTLYTNPGGKSAHPLFLEDENVFQKKIGLHGSMGNCGGIGTMEPDS
jgi:hypothetical protein